MEPVSIPSKMEHLQMTEEVLDLLVERNKQEGFRTIAYKWEESGSVPAKMSTQDMQTIIMCMHTFRRQIEKENPDISDEEIRERIINKSPYFAGLADEKTGRPHLFKRLTTRGCSDECVRSILELTMLHDHLDKSQLTDNEKSEQAINYFKQHIFTKKF